MQVFLILTAVESERQPLLDCLPQAEQESIAGIVCDKSIYHDKAIYIATCGMGTACAAIVASRLLYALQADAMLFCGTAGAIANSLSLYDVVIATHSYEVELQGLCSALADSVWEDGLRHPIKQQRPPAMFSANASLVQAAKAVSQQWHFGVVASSNTFPSPAHLISDIRQRGALAIDMETSALYQLGWTFDVPVLAIRCISNILQPDGTDPCVHEADPNAAAVYAANALLSVLDSPLTLV